MNYSEITKTAFYTVIVKDLLSKALSNDAKPTPGYLFPEIALMTQSKRKSPIVLNQLLKVITPTGHTAGSSITSRTSQANISSGAAAATFSSSSSAYTSSAHVLLKALKILRQLAQSGSVEFRISLARQGKGLLAEMVGYRGQWDEIHGDRFNENIRAAAEDLIEYMHANPVQELVQKSELTGQERAVLRNSTQDLQGFGNPDFEDSESEESDGNTQKSTRRIKNMEPTTKAAPPLPGFGNPAFENGTPTTESSMVARLVDRLQELTAPPPPMAMRAAFRQQEQRRQKLFVGEYSMRDETGPSKGKDATGSLMGTNPFRRTTRIIGTAAGGWSDLGEGDMITNRSFPLYRAGSVGLQYRNETSAAVYGLAQDIQTGLVRSLLLRNSKDGVDTKGEAEEDEQQVIWGVAQDICNVVLKALQQEGTNEQSIKSVPVLTGLLRDLNEWIEYEDWERRLRYLYVIDTLLCHKTIKHQLSSCSALPLLSKTLEGPRCQGASQSSVQILSTHLVNHIKAIYSQNMARSRQASGVSNTTIKATVKGDEAEAPSLLLLDIGA